MRKAICTASLLVLTLVFLVALFVVRVPDPLGNYILGATDRTMTLADWLIIYVVAPISAIFLAMNLLGYILVICSLVCERLRGVTENKRTQ